MEVVVWVLRERDEVNARDKMDKDGQRCNIRDKTGDSIMGTAVRQGNVRC